MAVSTSQSFDLDAQGIGELAWGLAGGEKVSGYEAFLIGQWANVLLQEWQNEGINSWTVEQRTQALTIGDTQYTLDADVVDVLGMVIRDSNSIDLPVHRIGRQQYLDLPNKDDPATPYQYWLDRQRSAPVMNVYPAPRDTTHTLVFHVVRRFYDFTGLTDSPDMPTRFLSAMIHGLAHKLAMTRPQIDMPRVQMLKAEYRELFALAQRGDTDRASTQINVDLMPYYWGY